MISHHQLKSVFPNLDRKFILALLRSLLILGLHDWPWSSVSFLISNMFFFLPNFASLIHFASLCIYLVRASPVNAPHSTWHSTYTDSYMHADRVVPLTVKQSSFISWWDHRSSMSHRLGDWHLILQALIGFHQIICMHLTCRNFICQHLAIQETTVK